MNLQKLNPWNWFKHEESHGSHRGQIPVKREANSEVMPAASEFGYHPIAQLHREIDRLFDTAFGNFGVSSLRSRFFEPDSWLSNSGFHPSLNVASDDSGYDITVEAPGMNEDDINIELKGDMLTITGNKKEEKEEKDKHFYRVERHYGTFQRVLSLPQDAEMDRIEASLKKGVLSIRVPRSSDIHSSAKRIPIKH